MFRVLFLTFFIAAVQSADHDPRLALPYKVDNTMSFLHEKIHDYKELSRTLRQLEAKVTSLETKGGNTDQLETAYAELAERLLELINWREWGEKIFSGMIHRSIPRDYLQACGYTDQDISDQTTIHRITFVGVMVSLLCRGKIYRITCASLAQDKDLRTVLIDHSDFFLYQRIVSAAAVLSGEIDDKNLIPLAHLTETDLLGRLAKAHYDGEVIAAEHRRSLANFMGLKMAYGIGVTYPEVIELVLKTVSPRILDIDGKYSALSRILRDTYPLERVRVGKKITPKIETTIVKTIVDQMRASGSKIEASDLLYFYLVDEISNRYFEKFITRMSLFTRYFDKTKLKFKPKPKEPSIESKIGVVKREISALEEKCQQIQEEILVSSRDFEKNVISKSEVDAQFANLQCSLEALNTSKQSLDERKTEKERKVKELTQARADLTLKLTRITDQIADLRAVLDQLGQERLSLCQIQIYTQDDVDTVQQGLESTNLELGQLNSYIQVLMDSSWIQAEQERQSYLRCQNDEKRQRIEALKAQIETLKKEPNNDL